MKRLWILLLLLAVFAIPARAEMDGDGVYTLYDDQGNELTMRAGRMFVGDEYISGDDRLYRVASVDDEARVAVAEHIGPAQVEPAASTAFASLIARAAKRYGDQCVVLSMDVKRVDGRFHVFARGGRDDTGLDAIDWVRRGVDSGAGEVVVNSIDTDGVRRGFDLEMLRAVGEAVSVPIIASGGAGRREDFLDVFRLDCVDAGLAASIFHSREVDIRALKRWLNENGVPMRLVEDGNDGL